MNESVPSFDLEAYASRYRGRGKIHRLRFIASHAPDLAADALRYAVIEAKKGRDSALYKDIIAQAANSNIDVSGDLTLDAEWVRNCDQWATMELEKLRYELEDDRLQDSREVIRTGHNNLGDFLHGRGKLDQARSEFIKTRDYSTHVHHNIQMCLKVITVSVEAGDFAHIESHCANAENSPDVDKPSPEMSKMRACSGLAHLVRGNYRHAADRFLSTNMESAEDRISRLQTEFGDVISLEDVATYGALCALATYDRIKLKKLIDHVKFRNLLELVPDIREIVLDFYYTRYTRCLQTMDKIRPDLDLDMYLSRDVGSLYKLIREKAIVQYVSPFVTADLKRMEKVFGTTTDKLEEELLILIENDEISARIDSERHVLHAKEIDLRHVALSEAVSNGKEALEDAEALLLRITLLKHGLEVSSNVSTSMNFFGPRGDSASSVAGIGFDGYPS